MTDQRLLVGDLTPEVVGTVPDSLSPPQPPPRAPNLAKSRRSRPPPEAIRRKQRALDQRERDRARAVDAQTHQAAHPLEDYLDHLKHNNAKLDRPFPRVTGGIGGGSDFVASGSSAAAAVSAGGASVPSVLLPSYAEEDTAAQDLGLPITVFDLAAAMVHDYCAKHATSIALATSGDALSGGVTSASGRGRKGPAVAGADTAAKRAKSPPLARSSTSGSTVDPTDIARTSAFLRKVVTVAGIASSSVLFAMMLVDRLRHLSLPGAAGGARRDLSPVAAPSPAINSPMATKRRSSRSRSRPRTSTASSPRASSVTTPLSASTPPLGAYSALSLSALDESRPSPSQSFTATPGSMLGIRRKSAIESSPDIPIVFTPLHAPPLPPRPSHAPVVTPPRSRQPTLDNSLSLSQNATLYTSASDPFLFSPLRKRAATSSLPTLSLTTTPPAHPPTSPLTSPLLPLFPTLIEPRPLTHRTWSPPPTLFITALMVAEKSLFDSVYRTSDWAVFTPYSIANLVQWEHDLCAALAWDVSPPASLDAWLAWVHRVQMALILGRVRPAGADPSYFEVGLVAVQRMGGMDAWWANAAEVVARSAVELAGGDGVIGRRTARMVGMVGMVVAWLAVLVGQLGG